MKSLFDKIESEKLIQRSSIIWAETKPLWGSMNAGEMFYHCNFTNKQVLEGNKIKRKSTFKEYALKIFALYLKPEFPKNIKGLKRNDAKGKISIEEFETQKKEFADIVRQISEHKKEIMTTHPKFGNLSQNEWGKALWKHLDHHLRQFGV